MEKRYALFVLFCLSLLSQPTSAETTLAEPAPPIQSISLAEVTVKIRKKNISISLSDGWIMWIASWLCNNFPKPPANPEPPSIFWIPREVIPDAIEPFLKNIPSAPVPI